MKYTLFIVFMALGFLAQPNQSQAHGDATSLPINSGGYVVEFEYAAPGQPVAGSAYLYAVRLQKQNSEEAVAFSAARVKLASKNGTALLTTIRSSSSTVGVAEFITTLPAAGDYTAEIKILDAANAEIASGTVTFAVSAAETKTVAEPVSGIRGWGIVVIALAVGLLVGWLLPRPASNTK